MRRNEGRVYNNGNDGNHVPPSLRLGAPAGNLPTPARFDADATRPHPVTASLRRSILDHAVHPSLAAQFDVQLLTRGDALQESPLGIVSERPAFNQEP